MNIKTIKRLHAVQRGAKIMCEVSDGSTYIIFHHLDGMYSYCTTEKGNVTHLSASAELVEEDGYYTLKD